MRLGLAHCTSANRMRIHDNNTLRTRRVKEILYVCAPNISATAKRSAGQAGVKGPLQDLTQSRFGFNLHEFLKDCPHHVQKFPDTNLQMCCMKYTITQKL